MNPLTPYVYKGSVRRVIDGDTLEVLIDLGFRHYHRATVRVYGIDTPETHGETREAGLAAAARLREMCPAGSLVHLESKRLDKYGRTVAAVLVGGPTGFDVARTLLAEGLARPAWRDAGDDADAEPPASMPAAD